MQTLRASDHVVVVGAGLAGWRFVEAVRRDGYLGAITLVGDESHLPYDRPPLSKQVLSGKWVVDKSSLATRELVGELEVTLRIGVAASGLDVAGTTVHLANGDALSGTHVVVATGARARTLAFSAGGQVHTLRTRDDATSLEATLSTLRSGERVAIIGGGFIGAEAATSLQARGFVPIVLEAAPRPLVNILGADVSAWLEGLSARFGVELRTDQRILDVVNVEDGLVVLMEDGSSLPVGAVIAGVGALVNDEWLATSGLTLDNGVVVDENLVAAPRVGAIGDVARFMWRNPLGEELVRIEHWQVANDHAAHLAHHWTTGAAPDARLVPYFWSDQYGKKIQMLGHPRPSDEVIMAAGSLGDDKWLALYSREGVVTGVVALSQPRALMLSKRLLDETTSLEDALSQEPWSG
ncbi:MAG: NAD(P)/FAD-dependent oxidoreductase [Acidimicrobiales bacterium]